MAIKKSVNDADHCLEVYSWCRTMIVQYVDKFLIVYWPLAWQHETYLMRCIKYLFLISRLLVTYFTGGVKGCSFFDPIHNQTDRKLTLLSMVLASAKVREGKKYVTQPIYRRSHNLQSVYIPFAKTAVLFV